MADGQPPSGSDPESALGVSPLQLEALLGVLLDHRVEFVIIGGFGLSAHGVIRATKDLDVIPDPEPGNLGRLVAALREVHAAPLLADDFDPAELGIEPDAQGLAQGGNWVLRTELGRLDVMQSVAGIRDWASLRRRALRVEVPNAGACLFASLDDMVAMKVAAGRPQDQIDVASLQRVAEAHQRHS